MRKRLNSWSRPTPRGRGRIAVAGLALAFLGAPVAFIPADARASDAAPDPDYPQRALRVIVGFPPGGSDDFIARALGPKLTEKLGQPVIVENHAGATANIAAALVARANPDGYTVFLGPTSLLAASRSLYPKLNYDLLKDFRYVTLLATGPTVLLANPSVPVKTLKDLVELARAKPNEIRYGSGGIGSLAHLAMELLESRAGIALVHVPYKGAAPNAMALAGGEIAVSFAGVSSSLSMINAGRLRALAVSGPRRVASLPDVPTIAESGYPGYDVSNTYGILAPAGTPPAIVAKLSAALQPILRMEDIKAKFATLGIEPAGSTSAAYRAMTEAEVEKWARVVKDANIKPE